MKRIIVRIELVNAREDDYTALDADLERCGFRQSQPLTTARIAQYTFNGDASLDAVAKIAQQYVMKTARRFFIFVSDPDDDKGLGIAG